MSAWRGDMGHLRLGTFPDRAAWHRVVELIADASSVDTIADATIEAAGTAMFEASHDPGVHRITHLLVEVCECGSAEDVIDGLRGRGILVAEAAGTFGLVAAFA